MQELNLYLVYFESANYAGYGEHVLVWATDELDAEIVIGDYAEEFYYEQDGAQLEEDENDTDVYASICSVELFDESHKDWDLKESFTQFN